MRRAALALTVALALAGCDGTQPASGIEALVRVNGGQYFGGAMPVDQAGPMVTAVDSLNNTIHPGQQNRRFSGRVADEATSVAIAMDGDRGYWIVPAGSRDLLAPTELTYDFRCSFSPALPLGPRDLVLRGVDAAGHFGPPTSLTLTAASAGVEGALVVSLRWDTEADLDLHVVLPDGIEVWARNLNSYQPPPPGELPDPVKIAAGGYLDFDSNSQCLIDGRRQENVVWKTIAPVGHFVVRVDTFSLCGEPGARWSLDVTLDGQVVAHSGGLATETDQRFVHEAGGGVLALEFDVP